MSTPSQRPFRQRRFKACLGALVLAALALRLGVGFELRAKTPAVTRPGAQTDMATYQTYARELLGGKYDWQRGFYYQPFYYAVFLPAVYALHLPDQAGVAFVQALLGAAAVGLTGLAFARLFGRGAGLLGAALLAGARMHLFYTPYALIAVLQSFWMALFLYLTVLAYARRRWWLWAVAGLALAAGTLTRGNLLLFLPLLLALLLWRERRAWRRGLALAALVVACFYVPQLPFAIVNYRVHGCWTGPSSAGGEVLALGNTPESPPGGREPWTGAGPMEYPEAAKAWVADEAAGGPSVGARAWQWVRREPLAYAELKLRMLLLFWNRMEVPNNVAERWVDPRTGKWVHAPSALLRLPVWPGFWLLGGLGLAGLVWAGWRQRRRPAALFAVAMALVYCAGIVLFYVLARFRVPLLPLLAGFGGVALVAVGRQWRRYRAATGPRKPRGLPAMALLLALALTVVGYGYDAYRHTYEAAALRLARPDGTAIEYADHWTVKDHGPWSFGGWRQPDEPLPGAVRKTFVVPAGAPPTATRLRLPLGIGDGAARLTVTTADGHTEQRALTWRRVTLTDTDTWPTLDLPAGTASVTLAIGDRTPGVDFWFDSQRQYGRTALVGSRLPPPGELVTELILLKEAPHAAP